MPGKIRLLPNYFRKVLNILIPPSRAACAMGNSAPLSIDALVVGGGFGGIYAVYKLRAMGLSVHLFEASSRLGGVWSNNQDPGARIDSERPLY